MPDKQNDKDSESPQESYEEVYKKLRESFDERLQTSLEYLEGLYMRNPFTATLEELQELMRLAHGLAGSGATFGYPHVTSKGQKLDHFLSIQLRKYKDSTLDNDDMTSLFALLKDLRNAVGNATQNGAVIDMVDAEHLKNTRIQPHKKSYNVMIVDDDNHLADIIGLRLTQKGMRVIPARDGFAALQLMSREVPDIIVLDIVMQGMSGHEVLMRLKKDPRLATIPVIMLTGKTEQKDVVSAIHTGAIDYIIKPVDIEKLIQRIDKILYAARHTVLLADNDHLILNLLESRYRTRGFKVLTADDGKKAWDTAMAKLPDIIILDRMMPGMDGMAVLKNLRSETATRNIPVIVLSARKEDRDIDLAMNLGANDYVIKPFLPDDLISRTINLLN